jgi:site-specific recombinase XerD
MKESDFMYEQNDNQCIRNCTDEAIIRMVGKISLGFEDVFIQDLDKQRQLKALLEESLYGYDIVSQSKELIISDMEEKIQLYLNCRTLENIAKGTIYNYNLILHKFVGCFNKPISAITTMDIRYFILACKKKGDKESTINSKIFALSKFFDWLLENEIILKDPTKQINIVGKGRKERTTFFSIKSKMLLEDYLKSRKEFEDHDSVFLGEKFPYKQLKSRALQVILGKIKDRAGLTDVKFITFHNLRKKCFTDGLSRGLSIAQIQAMAGHSSPSTTIQSYISLSNESLRSDYNKAML